MRGIIPKLEIGPVFHWRGWPGCLLLLACCVETGRARGEDARLSEIELRNLVELPPSGFLSEIEGESIFAGRKTFFVDPASGPVIGNNNFRQLLKRKTGVFLEEEEIPGVRFNLGMRGLAPGNSLHSQVLLDGIPLNIDVFGTRVPVGLPDLDAVAQVDFASGGTGVLWGGHPGGLVNFRSYPAAGDQALRWSSTATAGSYGTLSELVQVSGTVEATSYAVFGRYGQGDGYGVQQGYDSEQGGFRFTQRLSESDVLTLGYQTYWFSAGEMTPISRVPGLGINALLNFYYQDASRQLASAVYTHDFFPETRAESRVWFSYTDTERDYRAASTNLGVLGNETSYGGFEQKFMHAYDLGGMTGQVFTAGFTAQGSLSPFHNENSAGPAAAIDLNRNEMNFGFMVENLFQLTEQWKIIPGVRLDYLEIAGEGNYLGTAVNRSFQEVAPSFSLGTEWDILPSRRFGIRPATFYGNLSRGYRPPNYNEFVQRVSPMAGNLESAEMLTVEGGFRGQPVSWFIYDVSAFGMDYDGQFADTGGLIRNAGRTRHAGLELYQEVNLLGCLDALRGEEESLEPRTGPRSPEGETGYSRWGRLSFFTAVTWMSVNIEESPFAGNFDDTTYAPEWTAKWGLEYNWFERVKGALSFLHVVDHFGDPANSNNLILPAGAVPISACTVVDLSAEVSCWEDRLTFFVGLNNALGEDYEAARRAVAPGAVVQAPGQNIYGGFKFSY